MESRERREIKSAVAGVDVVYGLCTEKGATASLFYIGSWGAFVLLLIEDAQEQLSSVAYQSSHTPPHQHI